MINTFIRPSIFCLLFALSFATTWGQQIDLSKISPKAKPAPQTYRAPTTSRPASAPAKTYAQSSIKVKMDVSAKLIINVDADGKILRNEVVFSGSDVNTYLEERIYNGDATLEVKLGNGKSFRFNEYVRIHSDLSSLDIAFNNGLLNVKTKTKSQILEEINQRKIQMANDLVSSLRSSVLNLNEYNVSELDYKNSINQLKYKDLIDSKLHSACLELLASIQKSQGSYFNVKGEINNIEFYRSNSNYSLVYAARTDYSSLENSFNKAYKLWQHTSYSNSFLNRVKEYVDLVRNDLGNFPESKEAFFKKVAETTANWERIKAEEERKQKEIQERLAAERQARILREQEEARQREIQLRLEQERYRVWSGRSGAYLSASFPLGLELGVLASDRMGNVFGLRYKTNEEELTRLQIFNCFTFPISGPIQAGVTLGFGADQYKYEVFSPNPYQEVQEYFWDYGASFGARIMYVDQKIMGGLELLFGSECASGFFLVAGIKIGDL